MNLPLLIVLGIGGYVLLQDSKPSIKVINVTPTKLDFSANGVAFTADFKDPHLGDRFYLGAYELYASRHIENSALVGYQITVYNSTGKFLDLHNIPLQA